ncbi:MAG: GDSL-type esterase/lipase family protein, partial [Bacteroidota bacterium]
MKRSTSFFRPMLLTFTLLLVVVLNTGCSNEESSPLPPVSTNEIQILPLGDSRVEGNRPDHESYRYELWKLLISENLDIDFLGSQIDNAIYPRFNDTSFDVNHEGMVGDRTFEVLDRVNQLTSTNPSAVGNVVLLGVGGNDLHQGVSPSAAITNIITIIDALQEANPDVTILLERIAPGRSDFQASSGLTDAFNTFNSEITIVAGTKTTARSNVLAVDMSGILTDSDYADEIHYNTSGAQKIAQQYFN